MIKFEKDTIVICETMTRAQYLRDQFIIKCPQLIAIMGKNYVILHSGKRIDFVSANRDLRGRHDYDLMTDDEFERGLYKTEV